MVTKKTITIGAILLVILASSIILTLNNDVQFKITKTSSTFYINESGNWVIAATEANQLYSGSTKISAISSQTFIKNEVSNSNIKITRSTKYVNNATIADTYLFNGDENNKELFPISHSIEIFNASGLEYRYALTNINSTKTGSNVQSPQSFERKMKVEYDNNFKSNSLNKKSFTIKYNIDSDYKKYDIRLFDPIESLLINYPINGGNYNTYVSTINFSTNYTNMTNCSYNVGAGNITTNCSGIVTNLTSNYGNNTWLVYASENGTNVSSSVTFFQDNIIINGTYSSKISGIFFRPNSRYDQRLWPENQTYTKGVYNLTNTGPIAYRSIWMNVSNTISTWELQCNNRTSGNWTNINETLIQITSNLNAGRSQMIWCRVNLNNATSRWNLNVTFEGRL